MRVQPKERLKIAKKLLKKPFNSFSEIPLESQDNPPSWMTRAYSNNHYTVMIDDNAQMTDGLPAIKAMVQRHDDACFPNHWAEMQRIKNAIFGKEAVAVEYYPPEAQLVNRFNIYWLFVFTDGRLPMYMKESA